LSVTLTLGGLFWEVFVKSGVELVEFAEPSHSANRHLALPDCDEATMLDGWKELYLPMLKFLEGRLSAGAIIIADDLDVEPKDIAPYLDYVRSAQNGYVSVEFPIGDRLEVSLRY
jgi:hypothetical protein